MGINNHIIEKLKEAVAFFTSNEKLCILLFDEMAIQPHISFNTRSMRFEGFEDLEIHSTDKKLDKSALGTAKILKFFDNLFDSVNGVLLYPQGGKVLRCALTKDSAHNKFVESAIQALYSGMGFEFCIGQDECISTDLNKHNIAVQENNSSDWQ
ncbi:uncharacterized protein [Onthophagus taurus]|uniref:uncharacterized protein n=1 Tax=Onthophagus taurus TaxID=166361 RepID=UPI0039BE4605